VLSPPLKRKENTTASEAAKFRMAEGGTGWTNLKKGEKKIKTSTTAIFEAAEDCLLRGLKRATKERSRTEHYGGKWEEENPTYITKQGARRRRVRFKKFTMRHERNPKIGL